MCSANRDAEGSWASELQADFFGRRECRICQTEGCRGDPLYHPCRCTGTIQFVHKSCLDQWLFHSKKRRCELCGYRFRFKMIYRQDAPQSVPALRILKFLASKAASSAMTMSQVLLAALIYPMILLVNGMATIDLLRWGLKATFLPGHGHGYPWSPGPAAWPVWCVLLLGMAATILSGTAMTILVNVALLNNKILRERPAENLHVEVEDFAKKGSKLDDMATILSALPRLSSEGLAGAAPQTSHAKGENLTREELVDILNIIANEDDLPLGSARGHVNESLLDIVGRTRAGFWLRSIYHAHPLFKAVVLFFSLTTINLACILLHVLVPAAAARAPVFACRSALSLAHAALLRTGLGAAVGVGPWGAMRADIGQASTWILEKTFFMEKALPGDQDALFKCISSSAEIACGMAAILSVCHCLTYGKGLHERRPVRNLFGVYKIVLLFLTDMVALPMATGVLFHLSLCVLVNRGRPIWAPGNSPALLRKHWALTVAAVSWTAGFAWVAFGMRVLRHAKRRLRRGLLYRIRASPHAPLVEPLLRSPIMKGLASIGMMFFICAATVLAIVGSQALLWHIARPAAWALGAELELHFRYDFSSLSGNAILLICAPSILQILYKESVVDLAHGISLAVWRAVEVASDALGLGSFLLDRARPKDLRELRCLRYLPCEEDLAYDGRNVERRAGLRVTRREADLYFHADGSKQCLKRLHKEARPPLSTEEWMEAVLHRGRARLMYNPNYSIYYVPPALGKRLFLLGAAASMALGLLLFLATLGALGMWKSLEAAGASRLLPFLVEGGSRSASVWIKVPLGLVCLGLLARLSRFVLAGGPSSRPWPQIARGSLRLLWKAALALLLLFAVVPLGVVAIINGALLSISGAGYASTEQSFLLRYLAISLGRASSAQAVAAVILGVDMLLLRSLAAGNPSEIFRTCTLSMATLVLFTHAPFLLDGPLFELVLRSRSRVLARMLVALLPVLIPYCHAVSTSVARYVRSIPAMARDEFYLERAELRNFPPEEAPSPGSLSAPALGR